MNRDFVEMLCALSVADAEFVVVGAHALAAHGRPRATGDLDILVRPDPANAQRVWRALEVFGVRLEGLRQEDLATRGIVFQIGVVPNRIDILTEIEGVDFDQAWAGHLAVEIEGRRFPVLGRTELLINKRTTGRPQDLADVSWLEESD